MELNMGSITVEDVTIEVDYRYFKAHRGARDSFMGMAGAGPQLEPDEPAGVEINSIKMFGKEIEVSDESLAKIEEVIMKRISEESEDDRY